MFIGPILSLELKHRATRLRYRVIMVAYAAVLWLLLTGNYWIVWLVSASTGGGSVRESSEFARSFFFTFTLSQLIIMFLLAPAYVAGAIALEKERKTLDYLLTTDLRAWEIVLSKFAVRFFQLFLVQLAGLPVLAFAAWLGGIASAQILMSLLLSGSLTVALGGMSMLLSILTTRVRDAVIGTYVLAMIFIWGMPALLDELRTLATPSLDWLEAVEDVLAANPFAALGASIDASSTSGLWGAAVPALRNYSLFGIAAIAVSALCMRRVYLRQRFGRTERRRLRRTRERRPMPDDPVFWREQVGGRPTVLGRLAQWLVVLGSAGLVAASAILAATAVSEAWGRGWTAAEFTLKVHNEVLRWWGMVLGSLILLAVAIRASATITGERDAQTLDLILITPLEGWQVLKGKLLGCLWAVRWPAAALAAAWLLGTLVGAISPIALVGLTVEMLVYTVFAAAIGLQFSLRMRGSGGALASALGSMLFCFGGYFLCVLPCIFWFLSFGFSPPVVLGITAFRTFNPWEAPEQVVIASMVALEVAGYLVVYAAVAAALLYDAAHGFDRRTGRVFAVTAPAPPTGRVLAARTSLTPASATPVDSS